jgi:hypothetical protein
VGGGRDRTSDRMRLRPSGLEGESKGRAGRAGAGGALQRRFEGVSGAESRACLGIPAFSAALAGRVGSLYF